MPKSNGVKIITIEANKGLGKQQLETAVKVLKALLADEVLLYTKLRNYHWNVTGVDFYTLHAAFESQFKDIAELSDVVAERIRQYGVYAPGTLDEFFSKTRLREEANDFPNARTMVANLLNDHESIIRYLSDDIDKINEEAGDFVLVDLLTGFLKQHSKMAWMLRTALFKSDKIRSSED